MPKVNDDRSEERRTKQNLEKEPQLLKEDQGINPKYDGAQQFPENRTHAQCYPEGTDQENSSFLKGLVGGNRKEAAEAANTLAEHKIIQKTDFFSLWPKF
jgi:hypothetical protein